MSAGALAGHGEGWRRCGRKGCSADTTYVHFNMLSDAELELIANARGESLVEVSMTARDVLAMATVDGSGPVVSTTGSERWKWASRPTSSC